MYLVHASGVFCLTVSKCMYKLVSPIILKYLKAVVQMAGACHALEALNLEMKIINKKKSPKTLAKSGCCTGHSFPDYFPASALFSRLNKIMLKIILKISISLKGVNKLFPHLKLPLESDTNTDD